MTTPAQQPVSEADQELLSAYLDNQLHVTERIRLEQRLPIEEALRAELQELRALRTLLQELPAAQPPRSFTLDPAVGRPRGLSLFSLFRLGSGVATLLLMLTLLPSLLLGNAPVTSTASAPMSAAQPPAAAESEARAAAPTTADAAQQLPAPAAGAVAAESAAEPTANPAADTALLLPTPAATAAKPAPDALSLPSESTRTTMGSGAGGLANSGSASPGTQELEPGYTTTAPNSVPSGIAPLQWLQLTLAALGLLFAGAAVWVRYGPR